MIKKLVIQSALCFAAALIIVLCFIAYIKLVYGPVMEHLDFAMKGDAFIFFFMVVWLFVSAIKMPISYSLFIRIPIALVFSVITATVFTYVLFIVGFVIGFFMAVLGVDY